MKRIMYVVPGLNPVYKDGASNRVESFINCFSQRGYKVYVVSLTHLREYTNARKKNGTYSKNAEWFVLPHLFFVDSRIKNFVWSTFIKFMLLCLAVRCRCDYVLADYVTGAELTRWAKLRAKQIVNHRGDMIDEFKCTGNYDDASPTIKNLKYYMRRSVGSADMNICVSKNLQLNIEKTTNLSLKNCFIFPCCANIARFEKLFMDKRPEDRIVVGYFGGLNKWQCMDTVLEVFMKLRKKDSRFFFLLLTNSDCKPYEKTLERIGHENYEIKSLDFSEMPDWIFKMDVSFALRENRPLNIVSSPTKLSESLAAGVPVIVTKASGDYADMIESEKNGLVLEDLSLSDTDIERIYNFCLNVKKNRPLFFDVCRDTVKNRTWKKYADNLVQFIEDKLC